MTTREQQTWAMVGLALVIIILLLLDWGDNQDVVQPSTGGVEWPPFDPITFNLTLVPPGGYPYSAVFPPGVAPEVFNFLPGQPCGCGCTGAQTISGIDLSGWIAQLNASLKQSTITFAQEYFSTEPDYLLWTTNQTQVSQFNDALGLPPPITV